MSDIVLYYLLNINHGRRGSMCGKHMLLPWLPLDKDEGGPIAAFLVKQGFKSETNSQLIIHRLLEIKWCLKIH